MVLTGRWINDFFIVAGKIEKKEPQRLGSCAKSNEQVQF